MFKQYPADYLFNEERHEYNVAGVIWPSPTQLLKEFNLVDTRFFTDHHRQRGKAVHAATHYYDDGDLDEKTIHPWVKARLDQWKKYRTDIPFGILAAEKVLFSDIHRFGVTPDRIVNGSNGRVEIREIKTSASLDKRACRLQTAGQSLAVMEALGLDYFPHRIVIQLLETKYVTHEFTDYADFEDFKALVNVHWLKRSKS